MVEVSWAFSELRSWCHGTIIGIVLAQIDYIPLLQQCHHSKYRLTLHSA